MKSALFLALAGLVATQAQAKSLDASDACVKAAIEETNSEFPLNQPSTGKFYEWYSYNQSGWDTFATKNLGFTDAEYLNPAIVTDEIEKDFAGAADAAKKAELLSLVRGQKILSVSFQFQGGDLERFFTATPDANGNCRVQHIDTKIDDFDNG